MNRQDQRKRRTIQRKYDRRNKDIRLHAEAILINRVIDLRVDR